MSYEDRLDAMSDYITEKARELFADGWFNEDIVELILEGYFDEAVKQRMRDLG